MYGVFTEWGIWIGAALFIVLIIWLVIPRCPKCRSFSFSTIDESTMDRWVTTKLKDMRVYNYNTNKSEMQSTPVTITMEKVETTYKCNDCSHKWKERKEREVS